MVNGRAAVTQDEQKRLIAGRCVAIPLAQGSALDFPRPLVMPQGYALKEGSPSATACSGRPSGVGWEYTTTGAQGIPADVSIIRVTGRYTTADVAVFRVSVQVISGREAIIIKPGPPDGLAQMSDVLFPEPFGMTSIHAFNLPEAELLIVAAAVAEATR